MNATFSLPKPVFSLICTTRRYAMARRYDFDYNFDPEGTSLVKPDPYTDTEPVVPFPFLNSQRPASPKIVDRKVFIKPKGRRTSPFKAKSPEPEPIIQEPSKEYLAISSRPSSHIPDPKSLRKLLILDLNGTLVLRSAHQRRNVYQQPPTMARPLRTVHPRPYLTSFRDYLFHPKVKEWLDTMVWSSAQPHSVTDMVEKVFGSEEGLVAMWARDTLGLSEAAYFRKTQTTKDLEKPWAKMEGHSARTTFLLDDSPLKAHLQPWNHLCIQEYVGAMRATDVKVRDAEVLREKKELLEGTTSPPPRPSHDPLSPSATPAHLEAVEQPANDGDDDESKKRKREKRKEKKERKKAGKMAQYSPEELYPVDADGNALEYDQTLLAIVGILDHVKHEDNVSGWMRHSGLYATKTPPACQQDTWIRAGPAKKRRVSDESISEADAADAPPPGSPSPSVPSSPVHSVSGKEYPATAALMVPLDTNVWFQDPDTFEFWIARGRSALETLGLEPVPGVTGSTT